VADSIVIDSRFNGPPDSANGGYTCGLLAAAIDGPAEVTLRQPPPLARELTLSRDGDRVLLLDDDQLVAEAARPEGTWDVPPAVSLDEAQAAITNSHFLVLPRPFETCFVCGPSRARGDGLEIYAGPVEGRENLHAATWKPDGSVAGHDGHVRPEIVWASLDCPTSSPVANWATPGETPRPIVLARLAVDAPAPIPADAEYVITAWRIAVDGRKRQAGAALFTPAGELLASARALWIELRVD
jgi:hypothetical protein